MKRTGWLKGLILAAVMLGMTATPARAQRMELGASLAAMTIAVTGGTTTFFGVGNDITGFNPGMYVSFFAGPHLAIEPQVSLPIAISGGGGHLVNISGQVDYFLKDAKGSSPYVFGGVGIQNGGGATPFDVSFGAGYRVVAFEHIAMRIAGRYTWQNQGGGSLIGFQVALGGIFGGK